MSKYDTAPPTRPDIPNAQETQRNIPKSPAVEKPGTYDFHGIDLLGSLSLHDLEKMRSAALDDVERVFSETPITQTHPAYSKAKEMVLNSIKQDQERQIRAYWIMSPETMAREAIRKTTQALAAEEERLGIQGIREHLASGDYQVPKPSPDLPEKFFSDFKTAMAVNRTQAAMRGEGDYARPLSEIPRAEEFKGDIQRGEFETAAVRGPSEDRAEAGGIGSVSLEDLRRQAERGSRPGIETLRKAGEEEGLPLVG